MTDFPSPERLYGNLILDALSDDAYRQLANRLQRVDLRAKDPVGQRGTAPEFIHFPRTAVFSVLATMSDGSSVEICTIGCEGFTGIEALIGGDTLIETTICQIDGDAFRMPHADFREAIAGDTPLRLFAQRYLLAYLAMVSQSVACNRLHTVEERFARWVLMTQDRVGGNEIRLTQEFLALMLGVQRSTVSLTAGAFQQAGLIRNGRGRMVILDRLGLEEASCECYREVREQFNRFQQLNHH
jgi:CRP-like cAMP-binding protein